MKRDLISGVCLLGLGVVYYRVSDALPRSLLSDKIGADGFPVMLATALIFLAAAQVLQAGWRLLRQSRRPAEPRETKKRVRMIFPILMLVLGAAYLAAVSWIGYPLAVALLLLGVIRLQGEPLGAKSVLVSVGGGFLFWLGFVHLFNIPMPMGFLESLFAMGG